MKKPNQLILSDDGSHTLVSDQFGVSYHSTHGALQESITVFLAAGFQYARSNYFGKVRVLEMGFGTGLNTLLTLMEADKYRVSVEYTTLEAFPIPLEQAQDLNYIETLSADRYADDFHQMHAAASKETIQLSPNFTFNKHIEKLEDHQATHKYNVVYYDAFAPTTQSHLWDEAMMKHIYNMLADEAILVSYCAKGSFKRALKAAGFTVQNLFGPPGKREMTRAIKSK